MNTIVILGIAMTLCGTLPLLGVWIGARIATRSRHKDLENIK
jgi:hypothetical protein